MVWLTIHSPPDSTCTTCTSPKLNESIANRHPIGKPRGDSPVTKRRARESVSVQSIESSIPCLKHCSAISEEPTRRSRGGMLRCRGRRRWCRKTSTRYSTGRRGITGREYIVCFLLLLPLPSVGLLSSFTRIPQAGITEWMR